ncbi:phosphoribosyltransferase family protein [Staphylococcus aureus]
MSERIIMDDAAIQRTVTRIAHEILEYNKGTDNLILLGIKKETRGEYLANRIKIKFIKLSNNVYLLEQLILHTLEMIEHMSSLSTKDAIDIDTDITDKVVIIIDDVLYTGRTVRAHLMLFC